MTLVQKGYAEVLRNNVIRLHQNHPASGITAGAKILPLLVNDYDRLNYKEVGSTFQVRANDVVKNLKLESLSSLEKITLLRKESSSLLDTLCANLLKTSKSPLVIQEETYKDGLANIGYENLSEEEIKYVQRECDYRGRSESVEELLIIWSEKATETRLRTQTIVGTSNRIKDLIKADYSSPEDFKNKVNPELAALSKL